jgi:arabinose-5-phosphate isomerase
MTVTNSRIKSLFKIEGTEIEKLRESINADDVMQLITLIDHREGNVFLTGCGTSAMAAKKAVHTLRVVNIPAFFLNPSDAVHGALGAVHENDLVIFVSKGGNTQELTNFLPNLKEKKVMIVSITEDKHSILGRGANLVVSVTVARELDEFNMLATISTLGVIALFDVIAVSLMESEGFTKKQFLVNHPSGAVGTKLRGKAQ